MQVEVLEYTEEKLINDDISVIFDILVIDKEGNKINVEQDTLPQDLVIQS